jgi:hypothetical protein
MYQSFAFALAALGALCLVQCERHWLPVAKVISAVLIAGIGYYALQSLALKLTGQPSSGYIDSILDIRGALASPGQSLVNLGRGMSDAFGLTRDMYVYPAWAFACLLLLGIMVLLVNRRSPWAAAVFVAASLTPFGLHLFAGANTIPTRTLVAVPFVAWGATHLVLASDVRWQRAAGVILSCVAVIQTVYIFSGYQAAIRVAADYDRNLAAEIHARMLDQYPAAGRPVYLDVFGSGWVYNPYPSPPTSTVGRSFFDWGLGETRRIAPYMKLVGFTDIEPLPPERTAEFIDTFQSMPNWPASGSVRVIGDVALVRLGDAPDLLHEHVMRERQ